MSTRARVLKRFGKWHWWCWSCMGGSWTDECALAHDAARQHVREQH